MTEILNADDLYHTGIVVRDLDAAMAKLAAAGGYQWTNPLAFSLPVKTDAGEQQTHDFRFAYTLQSPHLELVQEIPGTIWTSAPGNAAHHLGFFVDDVRKKSAELTEAGFMLEVRASADGQSPIAFAYHKDPLGIRIEIVDRAMFGDFSEFLQQNRQ